MCFFFGHKWKQSPRKETQYYDKDFEEVPYSYRKSTGNYMFENVAWWSQKCTRCRQKDREDSNNWGHQPWYKNQYWAIKDAIHHSWFMFTFTLWPEHHEYYPEKKKPLWKRIPAAIAIWFIAGFSQYWIHFDEIPFFPAGFALDAEYKLMEWIDEV